MKHTPSPWKYVVHTDGITDTPAVTAQPLGTLIETRRDLYSFDECEANAALIAAAPDLLAALQSLADATAHYFRDFTHLHPSIAQPLEQARAALLKACPQGQDNLDTEN